MEKAEVKSGVEPRAVQEEPAKDNSAPIPDKVRAGVAARGVCAASRTGDPCSHSPLPPVHPSIRPPHLLLISLQWHSVVVA